MNDIGWNDREIRESQERHNEIQAAYNRGYAQAKREFERPKGWFHYEKTLTCLNCHSEFDDGIMDYLGDDVPKFCPWCGADCRNKYESEKGDEKK